MAITVDHAAVGAVLTQAEYEASSGAAHSVSGEAAQADQAAVEAETNEDTYVPPDLIKNAPGVAKAWIEWEQTGAHGITGSYNYTSVTDGGAPGNTDHVFATDFSNTTYAIVGMVGGANVDSFLTELTSAKTTTAITTITTDHANADGDETSNYLAAFGDQ